jgi:hypothetical protein
MQENEKNFLKQVGGRNYIERNLAGTLEKARNK